MNTCDDCGAPVGEASCEELFQRLLALDYSGAQPWGLFHAVNVASYALQHPTWSPSRFRDGQYRILSVFATEGLSGVRSLTTALVSANSHRRRGGRVHEPLGSGIGATLSHVDPPTQFHTTIHDVAVDGTFPAQGFTASVASWAGATRTAWARAPTGR